MARSRRNRLLALGAVGILAVALIAPTIPGLWVRWFGPHIVYGSLIGKTEQQVRQMYGQPVSDEDGFTNLGLGPNGRLPEGPIRTLVFKPRGLLHLEGGWQWAWFTFRGGEWVCFSSRWFADNVRF